MPRDTEGALGRRPCPVVVRTVDRSVLIDVSARRAGNPPLASIAFVRIARTCRVDLTDGELDTVLSTFGRKATWAPRPIGASPMAITARRTVCMPHNCTGVHRGANTP